jgi:phosphoribosylanthranilate isomerase
MPSSNRYPTPLTPGEGDPPGPPQRDPLPLVKICGITRLSDALAAVDAGAGALGFMFYPASVRAIALRAAADIIRQLPPGVRRVGVFVNPDETEVCQAIDRAGIDTLQFHGEESPEFCARFAPVTRWKAFRVRDRSSLDLLPAYLHLDAWLLDSHVPGQHGGTGATFRWELAVEASIAGRPLVLAGGLTPENVTDAVRRVRPFAVDVSSGVESAPGIKDPDKLRDFILAARA